MLVSLFSIWYLFPKTCTVVKSVFRLTYSNKQTVNAITYNLSLTGCLNYVAMGTKRTNRTIEDSLQLPRSPATPDRGNQSNEWISREARPQAGPKIQAERGRGGEDRRAREMDRIQDRPREGRRDVEQDQKERERFDQFRGRADEMDLRERDRRREQGRYTNGKSAALQQHTKEYRERENTFPRTMRQRNERERKRYSVDQGSEKLMERGMGRLREIDMTERERERERAKKRDRDIQRYREMERQRENERRRLREEMKRNAGRRLEEGDLDKIWQDPGKKERRGERHTEVSDSDQQSLRRQEKARDRDRPREDLFHSPQTRRIIVGDRKNFSDREERDERKRTGQKERHRHTKSEGDTDGEKERELEREEDAMSLRLDGRIEVDNEKERTKGKLRERERRRDVERQKERARRKEKETALQSSRREENKEWMMERYKDRDVRERDWAREKRGHDGPRDQLRGAEDRRRKKELNESRMREHERDRERACIPSAEREMDMYPEWSDRQRQNCYEEETKGRNNQTWRETDRKIQEEAQSSREWMPGSDVQGDHRRRRTTDSFEEKERRSASEDDNEKKRSEEGQDREWWSRKEEIREGSEKEETETEREREKSESKKRPQRKMWLEPQSGRERTESLQEDFKERQQARARYAQRYKEQKTPRDEEEMSTERKNGGLTILLEDRCRELDSAAEVMKDVDPENLEERIVSDEMVFDREAWLDVPWQSEVENVSDNMEESDREEEQVTDTCVNSEGEEGSEGVLKDWRDKVTSGDNGFVMVSSGAEEDEAEVDRFEDCTEVWDGGDREGLARQSPTSTQQREEESETSRTKERSDSSVTVFCVVGQTLPRSGSNQSPFLDHMEQQETCQESSWEMGGVGGDQNEAPNRDTEAESTSIDHGLSLSEEDISSSHDTKCNNAGADQMTKEVTSSKDLVISCDVIAEKDAEQFPTESTDTLTEIEAHGNAQMKMTDGENQAEGQNEMESGGHCEGPESMGGTRHFSAAQHVKWAKNVLTEILGSSEDGIVIIAESSGDGVPTEAESQGDAPLYASVQKSRKPNHDRECIDSEVQHFKPEDTKTDVPVGNEIHLQVQGQLDGEEDLERLSDLQSLSSDNETDKEGSSKEESIKTKKKNKKKAMWKILGSNSFRELGNEVWEKTAGIRRSVQKHSEEEEEAEGAGRDRRTRVFKTGEKKLGVNCEDVI